MSIFLKRQALSIISICSAILLLQPLSCASAADSDKPEWITVTPAGISLGAGLLREPLGLAAGPSGELFVADAMAGKVFVLDLAGEASEFETPSLRGTIYPIDLAVNGPFVYVLDYNANRLLRFDSNGAFLDVLISFEEMERMSPVSITAAGGGRLITTDIKNHGLAVWSPLLDLEFAWNDYGWSDGAMDRPMKGAMSPDERIIVCDSGNRRVQVFSPSGRFEAVLELPAGTSFGSPRAVTSDAGGNIFVADADGGAVHIFTRSLEWAGKIDSWDGKGISPSSLAVGWDSRLYIADLISRSVLVFTLEYGEER